MPVDPIVLSLLADISPPGTPRLWEFPPKVARSLLDSFAHFKGPMAPSVSLRDARLANVPVRIYRAAGALPQPAFMYFHGGGWALGSVSHYDSVCSQIAHGSAWTVISVEYRLAPEYKFPLPLLDCWMALEAVRRNATSLNIDPSRIVVGGDSAGGNLSAAATLLARDYDYALTAQILIYPVTDYPGDRASYEHDFLISKAAMQTFWAFYLNHPSQAVLPLAAPLRAESFSGLPPALIITAEYDPLRDEGEEYAERLKAAGVSVTLVRYAGMVHGFLEMAGSVPQAIQALKQITEFLARF
jgi:acetyl esterase